MFRGLRDDRRRGIVERYLQEWGAMVACIHETKLECCQTQDWNMVGRGLSEAFLVVNANRRSRGVIVA